jgi:hypothetical protein
VSVYGEEFAVSFLDRFACGGDAESLAAGDFGIVPTAEDEPAPAGASAAVNGAIRAGLSHLHLKNSMVFCVLVRRVILTILGVLFGILVIIGIVVAYFTYMAVNHWK